MFGPIKWFGGKGGTIRKKMLSLFPKHVAYVEVFGGGAGLLFGKRPSALEVYNDLDSNLVNFFHVLRDKDKFQEFYRFVSYVPYSREEYYECRDTWKQTENEIERVAKWFVVARQSFSGVFGASWCHCVNSGRAPNAWMSCIDRLPEIHRRLLNVQIEHYDFRILILKYDRKETFFYLDPPYVHLTRKCGKYDIEMTDDDHKQLVEILLDIKGKALLSGYMNDIYLPLENDGWQRKDFEITCPVNTQISVLVFNAVPTEIEFSSFPP